MWDKPLEDKCLSKQVWFQYNYLHIYIYIYSISIVLYVLSWIGLTTSQWFPCCMRGSETQIHKCSLLYSHLRKGCREVPLNLPFERPNGQRSPIDEMIQRCICMSGETEEIFTSLENHDMISLVRGMNGIPILSDSGTPKKSLHQTPQPLLEWSVLPTYASLPFPAPPALYSVDAKRGILRYPLKDRQYHICSSW